jgi:hypothetical protein
MIDFLKNIFGGDDDMTPLKPPKPYNYATLMCETPENICRQYLSMEDKTKSYFNIAMSKESFQDFCTASMRLAAYSTVAVHGFVLFLACMDMHVSRIMPNKYNKLIYSDFLLEVLDFSWVMLQHCLFNSDYGKEKFGREKIISFLESEVATTGFPFLLMINLVTKENASFAENVLKEQIELKGKYGVELDGSPSEKTKQSFDQMVSSTLIGNPNTFQSFNASYQVKTFSDLDLVTDIGNKIRDTILYDTLVQRVQLHLR